MPSTFPNYFAASFTNQYTKFDKKISLVPSLHSTNLNTNLSEYIPLCSVSSLRSLLELNNRHPSVSKLLLSSTELCNTFNKAWKVQITTEKGVKSHISSLTYVKTIIQHHGYIPWAFFKKKLQQFFFPKKLKYIILQCF